MRYQRFEDVPVWQAGIELARMAFCLTQAKEFRPAGDIANQLQRAALSVSNNIAEGFERGTTPELITFLYYARGSAGEVRSICHVLLRLDGFASHGSRITELREQAASISRQLGGWLKSLKESDLPGQRHFTTKDRVAQDQKKRADAFMEKIRKDTHARILQRTASS